MRPVVTALILTAMAILLLVAAIVGVIVSSKSPGSSKDESIKDVDTGRRSGDPAKCSELNPAKGLSLITLKGFWVLQEKLEFPVGMTHHAMPDRDQTAVCLRTEFADVSMDEATLKTQFFMNRRNTRNITGFVKVKENGHWNMHMLAKDHDGMVVHFDVSRYFVFIECVKSASGAEYNVPASVFVYTRGNLAEKDMARIRADIENLLRHNDETFLDFGGYCYN